MRSKSKSEEKFVPIPDYETRYAISKSGKVKSLKTNKIMSPVIKNGYVNLHLYKNGKYKTGLVHRLVAKTFLKKPPKKKNQVDHRDGNKLNNHVSNLRYVSQSKNMKNAHKNNSNLSRGRPVIKTDLDNIFIERYDSIVQAARENNLCENSVFKCCKDIQDICGGFKWKYEKEKETKEIILESDEIFKKIDKIRGVYFNRYGVSNYGKIKNIEKNTLLKPLTSTDYNQIRLRDKNGKIKYYFIHTLVAYFFKEKNNDAEYQVNHIDKNKKNNYYKNLEWVTRSENSIHSHGKKICKVDKETGEIINTYASLSCAGRELGISGITFIAQTCKGKYKYAYGFGWKYFDDAIQQMVDDGYVETKLEKIHKYKSGTIISYIKNNKIKYARTLQEIRDDRIICVKNGQRIYTLFSDIERLWILKN